MDVSILKRTANQALLAFVIDPARRRPRLNVLINLGVAKPVQQDGPTVRAPTSRPAGWSR